VPTETPANLAEALGLSASKSLALPQLPGSLAPAYIRTSKGFQPKFYVGLRKNIGIENGTHFDP
jgi:hypothetical protein